MEEIRIPYGKGYQTIHVEKERLAAVLSPHQTEENTSDGAQLVRKALEKPIASPRLCELTRDKKRVLVITSDHTRPVPSKITMPLLHFPNLLAY